ncbi:MAG: hypothetical protein R6V41_05535 [Desulfobacteraceae bacterium]
MIELFSLKFWIGVQFIIDLVFILFFLVFVRRLGRKEAQLRADRARQDRSPAESSAERKKALKSADDIIGMLEPLVLESRKAAESFEKQIKEKKNLIKNINDSLDSRIISINLLMSRAESVKDKLEHQRVDSPADPFRAEGYRYARNSLPGDVLDQQNSIVDLYNRGYDAEAIAARLSMPRGEVKLVIDLKEKFKAMELTD